MAHLLLAEHGNGEAGLACVSYLCRRYMTHLGGQSNTNMDPLIDLLDAALVSYAKANKLEVRLFRLALEGLERAGETLRYLASYPDTVF